MKCLTPHLFAVTTCLTAIITAGTAHAMPSQEKMWEMIQQQQKQIEALQKQVQNNNVRVKKNTVKVQQTEYKVTETAKKTEAVADSLDEAINTQAVSGGQNGWWNKTSIGGYGELHYNNYRDSDDGTDEIDFHRLVLFFGHEFNDNIRFFSELELEHSIAGEGKNGEIELEQAYVEFDIAENHQAQAGVFLLPVGILNETHEPPTFFGVERNPVEKNIIPATWWEAGVGVKGELGYGFSYHTAIHSGLSTPVTGANAFKVRNGRQKTAKARAESGAVTTALRYTGIPGVKLGVTGQYQQDITQDMLSETVSATLLEAHADIRRGGWGLRALYARWDLDGMAAEAIGRDEQVGFYVEPSYRFTTSIGDVGFFTRYNYWDNEAGNGTGSAGDNTQWDVGVNYWPHEDVVLKADMAFLEDTTGNHIEIFNLGVGYQF